MEAFKNKTNKKKFKKALRLLNEIQIDGEDMETLVGSLNFEFYLTYAYIGRLSETELLAILKRHKHPMLKRFLIIEGELVRILNSPYWGNIMELCNIDNTNVNDWEND